MMDFVLLAAAMGKAFSRKEFHIFSRDTHTCSCPWIGFHKEKSTQQRLAWWTSEWTQAGGFLCSPEVCKAHFANRWERKSCNSTFDGRYFRGKCRPFGLCCAASPTLGLSGPGLEGCKAESDNPWKVKAPPSPWIHDCLNVSQTELLPGISKGSSQFPLVPHGPFTKSLSRPSWRVSNPSFLVHLPSGHQQEEHR